MTPLYAARLIRRRPDGVEIVEIERRTNGLLSAVLQSWFLGGKGARDRIREKEIGALIVYRCADKRFDRVEIISLEAAARAAVPGP